LIAKLRMVCAGSSDSSGGVSFGLIPAPYSYTVFVRRSAHHGIETTIMASAVTQRGEAIIVRHLRLLLVVGFASIHGRRSAHPQSSIHHQRTQASHRKQRRQARLPVRATTTAATVMPTGQRSTSSCDKEQATLTPTAQPNPPAAGTVGPV